MRIAAGIEYHGAAYRGWQSQPHAPSVQQTVEDALSRVADAPVELTCAGRTDSGVHAREQVVHFDTHAERSARAWVLGTNTHLPSDISLRWAQPVPDDFHARFSARSRHYRYLILNQPVRSALAAGRALCVFRPLDAQRMQAAGSILVGEHDFSAFRASECQSKSPVRRMQSLTVARDGEWLSVDVIANAFLHHMVRNIVGLLVAIGCGDEPLERAREQLESRRRSTGEATAAAQGLYFWRAEYAPEFGLPDDSAMIATSGMGWGRAHVLV